MLRGLLYRCLLQRRLWRILYPLKVYTLKCLPYSGRALPAFGCFYLHFVLMEMPAFYAKKCVTWRVRILAFNR